MQESTSKPAGIVCDVSSMKFPSQELIMGQTPDYSGERAFSPHISISLRLEAQLCGYGRCRRELRRWWSIYKDYISVCQPWFRATLGFREKSWTKSIKKFLKYGEKFQISLEISREFLSGNRKYWNIVGALKTASLLCFVMFKRVGYDVKDWLCL